MGILQMMLSMIMIMTLIIIIMMITIINVTICVTKKKRHEKQYGTSTNLLDGNVLKNLVSKERFKIIDKLKIDYGEDNFMNIFTTTKSSSSSSSSSSSNNCDNHTNTK